MLRFFCDICHNECKDPEFIFDATIMETIDSYDLTSQKLNVQAQKKMEKRQIQICKTCYDKNIKTLIK